MAAEVKVVSCVRGGGDGGEWDGEDEVARD